MVLIIKGKGDIRNCNCHKKVKLLEHGMKVVESVLKKLCEIVTVNKICMRKSERCCVNLEKVEKEYHNK